MADPKKKPAARIKPVSLTVPAELNRIKLLRDKLVKGGAEKEDIEQLNAWEEKVKKSTILLSLQGHEGIAMILARIDEELSQIDESLLGYQPTDLSPEGSIKYAVEQHALFKKQEMYLWFRQLFTDAKRDIKEVRADLDAEDEMDIPGA